MVNEFSWIVALVLFNIAMLVVWFFRRRTMVLLKQSTAILLLISMMTAVRILLPLELPKTYVINSYGAIGAMQRFVQFELIEGILRIGHVILIVWVVGGLIVLGHAVFLLRRDYMLRRQYRIIRHEQVEAVAAGMDLKRVNILVSPDVRVPHVMGFFRARVYLPVIELSDEKLALIIRHEVQHFRSHDAWMKLFYWILLAVFWWNPIVHIFQRELDRVLEVRCDSNVTKEMDEPEKLQYLDSIISVVKNLQTDMVPLPTHASGFTRKEVGGDFLSQRFQLVLEDNVLASRMRKGQWLAAGLVCLAFVASFMFLIQPAGLPPQGDLDAKYAQEVLPENSYLLYTSDGQYEWYLDGISQGTISEVAVDAGFLEGMPIIIAD